MRPITIDTRQLQPYAAYQLRVHRQEIPNAAPPLVAKIIRWVQSHGGQTAGAPFFNYVTCHADGTMDMQVGIPTATVLQADDQVITGTLQGGRYASLVHQGPYDQLHQANMDLLDWAKAEGHALDGAENGDCFAGATRLEIYRSDPDDSIGGQPVTEVAFRLAD